MNFFLELHNLFVLLLFHFLVLSGLISKFFQSLLLLLVHFLYNFFLLNFLLFLLEFIQMLCLFLNLFFCYDRLWIFMFVKKRCIILYKRALLLRSFCLDRLFIFKGLDRFRDLRIFILKKIHLTIKLRLHWVQSVWWLFIFLLL